MPRSNDKNIEIDASNYDDGNDVDDDERNPTATTDAAASTTNDDIYNQSLTDDKVTPHRPITELSSSPTLSAPLTLITMKDPITTITTEIHTTTGISSNLSIIPHRPHNDDTTTNSATTNSKHNIINNDYSNYYYPIERPTNLRLVIMGDSISRYQYISLVYFLQTGTWITKDTKMTPPQSSPFHHTTPLHCQTPGIRAREQFYTISHSFLQPNEILCDGHAYSENRYYMDTLRNNSITYITKFGKNKTSGRYLPKQIHTNIKTTTTNNGGGGGRKKEAWMYKYWNETIHYHIAQLQPKPQYLLFNAGLHKHDLYAPYIRQGILDATKRHDIIPIYKTTTYPNNRSIGLQNFALSDHDSLLCGGNESSSASNATRRTNVPSYCLDMSWTSQLYGDDHYYDYYHFKPYWNYYMNLQTLLYIEQIELQRKRNTKGGTSSMVNVVPTVFRSDDVERRIRDSLNMSNDD